MLFLLRLVRRTSRHSAWVLPLAIICFVFVTGWIAMVMAQPGSEIVRPDNYWWWFLVTATTVGYGDLFPETAGGRVVGAYVVFGSITTLAILFSRISAIIENAKGRRMRGEISFSGTSHIVLLGYTSGRTERLLAELLSEPEREVVLATWEDQLTEHPMAGEDRVHFVRGDLTDLTVLSRTGIGGAHSVLIDARDDNEAVTLTVAANAASPSVHTIVALRDLRVQRTIFRVDSTVHCVQWHNTQLIAEELSDPGIAEVYQELATAGGKGTYSLTVPDSAATVTVGTWQSALGRAHDATLLAVRTPGGTQVSPSWELPVGPGARLFYIASDRLEYAEVVGALG
ncbi:voltage-gated potassium channel [Nocardioides luteus]|uniref:Potassium channel protein n=1 Tax=Nocardioides luteus TaxID=1844 RepID=A0ABQ5SXY0_9ACTN|nr:ion channel [Nocardioides luteus]MDR7312787.1 voltage-gated potassium channel [Nocardioides luteus]GGR47526.1 potassium channel protein [Nocardioides luteus]GLJ69040.1 potassium channel protein [Nocardioides luteus]